MLLQDVRDYQILFLSLFLFLGIGTRDWTLRPDLMLVVLVTCLATQWIAMLIRANLQVLVSFLLGGRGGELTWDDAWGDSSRSLGDLPPKPPTEGRLRPPGPLQKGLFVEVQNLGFFLPPLHRGVGGICRLWLRWGEVFAGLAGGRFGSL